LRESFSQVKKFLTINESQKVETDVIDTLKKSVSKLQEDLTIQKAITDTISEKNVKLQQDMKDLNEELKEVEEKMWTKLNQQLERFGK